MLSTLLGVLLVSPGLAGCTSAMTATDQPPAAAAADPWPRRAAIIWNSRRILRVPRPGTTIGAFQGHRCNKSRSGHRNDQFAHRVRHV